MRGRRGPFTNRRTIVESRSSTVFHDEYVMGRTLEEYQRLRKQAQAFEPATRRILQQIGLREGMSCLDVGCGPGEVMRLIGEFVGPSGIVTGLDCDNRLGNEAVEVLRTTQKSQFQFIECDLESVDEIEGQPFDVTYARLVLIHVRDPLAALRKMYAWTKPGGYVVVQDFDMRTIDLYPRLAAWAEFERVVFGVFERTGKDTRIGYKLPAYFAEAGLGAPDGTDVTGFLRSLQQASPMLLAVYRSLLPKALELSITTQENSASSFREIEKATVSEQFYSHFGSLLIGVWKRKPV
jgi:ubiquinone/menaquinone biosynthesis C-methylase UbiE